MREMSQTRLLEESRTCESDLQKSTLKSALQSLETESIVNHDHITVITRLGTHFIVRGLKRSNLRKSTFKLNIQLFIFAKNLAKQLVLIVKGILKLDDSKGKTLGGMNHHLHQS
jgi:hypothetical protein